MPIVIAQLTDAHLRAPGEPAYGVDPGAHLDDAVRAIIDGPVPVDAVLVTGDLVDRGREDEYGHFRERVAPLRVPLLVGAGNHDGVDALARAFSGIAERTDNGDIAYAAEVGPLRIVMLDSSVAGASHGEMSPERLRWLDDTLAARPSQPTLLAMHHPPFRTGIPHMDAINCHNGDSLAALLDRHPQVLTLACGHVHRSIFTQFAGRPASVAPSTAYAVCLDFTEGSKIGVGSEPAGLHFHAWSPEDGPYGNIVTHRVAVNGRAQRQIA